MFSNEVGLAALQNSRIFPSVRPHHWVHCVPKNGVFWCTILHRNILFAYTTVQVLQRLKKMIDNLQLDTDTKPNRQCFIKILRTFKFPSMNKHSDFWVKEHSK